MVERELIMIPGPTNVDPSVLRALSKPTVSHVNAEFVEVFKQMLSDLRKVFMTSGETLVIAGTGTLAMEAAVANILEPGDKVLNLVSGMFGQRFTEISRYHKALPTVVEVPWGKAVEANLVKKALTKDNYKAVTVVHVDTSTGVANPIKEIGEVVKNCSDAFYIVDTICSLGGMEVRTDDWQIDVCLTASQKCLGLPPGLALLALSRDTIEFLERRKKPIDFYYGDFMNWLPIMRDPSKYFATPPVNMIYALSHALKLILGEGLEKRFKRHHTLAEAVRSAINALKLNIVADHRYAADTVTAVFYPTGINDQAFRNTVKQHGVTVAGGLGPLVGKTFRMGHMGNVNFNDIMATIGAIEIGLREQGYDFEHGSGLRAAQEKLLSHGKV